MLHIQRLTHGLYDENAYLVYLPERHDALMIDPGDRADLLLDAIQASGKRLGCILLTHGHFDHILAVPELRRKTGAKVCAHPLDAPMLQSSYPLKLPSQVAERFEPSEADTMLTPGRYSICGLEVEVLHTPGHTKGGLCFYLPRHQAVFTGDTLFQRGFGRTDFAGGSSAELRQSLFELFSLPADTMVYPGHGDSDTLKNIVENYR